MGSTETIFDAWNPGLESEIPPHLMSRATLFAPENACVSYEEARDTAALCGMKPQQMAALRVARLAVHEVLIRVTADLYVPDGPAYEELGLNLRSMSARILNGHIARHMAQLEERFDELRDSAEAHLATMLDSTLFAPTESAASPAAPSLIDRLMGRRTARAARPALTPPERAEFAALATWQKRAASGQDPLEAACTEALIAVVGGIIGQRGRLVADRTLILRLALNRVMNGYGSTVLGTWIDPLLRDAAEAEGYRRLPHQDKPFVMNVKGASAAGKSTIRPLQRELAERLGVAWEDFALVSPDYWRKFLLDYGSLGSDYKYAAMLTGQELEIIDRKLDRYMEWKATHNRMPHLLIDRFRFDSFESVSSKHSDGHLLSRFGDTVFMFFVITPPTETVERAWSRGKETGRYKAVDDLLYHNIEAYTGMPQLFFSWVNKPHQKVHFEFLDNSVPYGARPRTVAFGWNGQLTILDPAAMRRLMRYRHINVDARRPEEVYLEDDDGQRDILDECIARIPSVTFAEPDSGRILGQTTDGRRSFDRDAFFASLALDHVARAGEAGQANGEATTIDRDHERQFTVGDWSPA